MPNSANLASQCKQVRRDILTMLNHAGSGHPGGSLSSVELLTTLYLGGHLQWSPDDPKRDRFILSKGHGVPTLYAILKQMGHIEEEELLEFRQLGSRLQGHPDSRFLSILEANTGSLGQGLSIGIGMALSARLDGDDWKTFVMLGDGELNEGQIWEAAMFASHHKLSNLVCILDINGLQLDDETSNIVELEPLGEKFASFGWEVIDIDGHDLEAIEVAYKHVRHPREKPLVIIGRTIKGKGVSFMEGQVGYHGVAPSDEELQIALGELL